jgi:hypothetical protein
LLIRFKDMGPLLRFLEGPRKAGKDTWHTSLVKSD